MASWSHQISKQTSSHRVTLSKPYYYVSVDAAILMLTSWGLSFGNHPPCFPPSTQVDEMIPAVEDKEEAAPPEDDGWMRLENGIGFRLLWLMTRTVDFYFPMFLMLTDWIADKGYWIPHDANIWRQIQNYCTCTRSKGFCNYEFITIRYSSLFFLFFSSFLSLILYVARSHSYCPRCPGPFPDSPKPNLCNRRVLDPGVIIEGQQQFLIEGGLGLIRHAWQKLGSRLGLDRNWRLGTVCDSLLF